MWLFKLGTLSPKGLNTKFNLQLFLDPLDFDNLWIGSCLSLWWTKLVKDLIRLVLKYCTLLVDVLPIVY